MSYQDKNNDVVLVTGRYWEGAYVFKELIDKGVSCKTVFIQKSWWKEKNDYEYSNLYLEKLKKQKKSKVERFFFTIEELAKLSGTKVEKVDNINSTDFIKALKGLSPKLILVVGSRIIKEDVLDIFENKFINFHTGILPEFRGPYSEFWAMYKNRPDMIGTTIHFIDKGIDTGKILGQARVDVGLEKNINTLHFLNVKKGSSLMAKTVLEYLNGDINPVTQEEEKSSYYSYPSNKEIKELEDKLGVKINLYFAD